MRKCKRCSKLTDNFIAQKNHPEKLYAWCETCREEIRNSPTPESKKRGNPNHHFHRIAAQHNERAKNYGCEGTLTASDLYRVALRYGSRCLKCNRYGQLEFDHVIPLYRGGPNIRENLQPLCHDCNSLKATTVIDYRIAA